MDSVSRDTHSPFIHRFVTSDFPYIYDVNTNRIIQVNKVVSDIMGQASSWQNSGGLKATLPQYSLAELEDGIRVCSQLHSELGFFSDFRPKAMHRFKSIETAEKEYESHLQQLKLEVTQACNLRCKYGAYSTHYPLNRAHTDHSMSFEVARKAIDFFLKRSTGEERPPSIGFYGGEPLINMALIRKCIEYVQADYSTIPIDYNMTTNGTLLTGGCKTPASL